MFLEGTICPVVTPVTGRRGRVDREALASLTRTLVDAGVDGVFPAGTTGEFPSLSRQQRGAAVEAAVEGAGDAPVLAGCCATSVDRVRALATDAADAGADAAVVTSPYYFQGSEDGVREFFLAVADASPLPVLVYDIPAHTGRRIAVSTLTALADHENVVGVKDSSGDLGYFSRLLAETPDDWAIFQGSTANIVPSLDMGADGVVSGVANVLPETHAALYRAHAGGDRERAVELMNDAVYPVVASLTDVPTISGVKWLTAQTGVDAGPPLPPLPELTADQRRQLEGECVPLLERYG